MKGGGGKPGAPASAPKSGGDRFKSFVKRGGGGSKSKGGGKP